MFYKEITGGMRVRVTEDQWAIDRHDKGYVQIIAQPGLTIYRLI